MSVDKYEAVIGLELHVQLNTVSKIYSGDATTYGALPNSQVNPISLGHPGTLPKVNKKVLESAIKLGIACHSTITHHNQFARKNYFYADLPKGYQVTQDTTPICRGGYILIKDASGEEKKIALTRIHMEEDSGKSIHDQDPYHTLVDLNRAGIGLLEIVSEPELRSGEEAYNYVTEVRKIVRYLGICDGNMEEGSLRCDANVSVRLKGATQFGQRTEVKNMNSIRNVQRAIQYEIKRQIEEIENGGKIKMETRSFDAVKGVTFTMRSKEEAHDYRYFPEPDLQPVVLKQADIDAIESTLPDLPAVLFKKYVHEFGLSDYDAGIIVDNKAVAMYFEELIAHTTNYKAAANWLIGPVKSYLNERAVAMEDFPIPAQHITQLIALIDEGKLSNTLATQKLFPLMLDQPQQEPVKLAQQHDLIQDSSADSIEQYVATVINNHPAELERYRSGSKNLFGFFMGELMKLSKGKADPKLANQLLRKQLES
jgi:aspartyl-tRNA(Asn)/glutamyl-tRNA(Gln) amidotransferase subunit B